MTRPGEGLLPSEARRPPRVCYIDPLAVGALPAWPSVLAQVARLGFRQVMLAPIFAGPVPFLPADLDTPNGVFESTGDVRALIGHLAELCAARGLELLLDVPLSALAAAGSTAATARNLFEPPDPARALDPRTYTPGGDVARARFAEDGLALADWWAERLGNWAMAGAAGFRLLGLEHVTSASLARMLAGARARGDITAFGWTLGVPAGQQDALRGCGLDYVFSSLPYWDLHADWFWHEQARLSRIAPVVMPVEAPFGPRLAAHVADPARRAIRAKLLAGLAATLGDGWLMPMGFGTTSKWRGTDAGNTVVSPELAPAIEAATALAPVQGPSRIVHGGSGPTFGVMRTPSGGHHATLILANRDFAQAHPIALEGALGGYTNIEVDAAAALTLAPGEIRALPLAASPPLHRARPPLSASAKLAADGPRVAIEAITPSIEGGLFPAKRIVGELVRVEADVIADGHDKQSVALLWRQAGEAAWSQTRMRPLGNDRWGADFPLTHVGRYVFTVEAWRDAFASFRDEFAKKHAAGLDVRLEAMEGAHLVEAAATSSPALKNLGHALAAADLPARVETLLADETARLMAQADTRPRAVRPARDLLVEADRPAAQFASWYEIFPRSMSDDETRHGTFADVVRHLPRIRDMGFDVLYFPPIHPIGRMNRKGRNNSLKAEPGDVGSPYAIGGAEGGHDAVHPELGTLADFRHMIDEAAGHGLEIAIDFAVQCSPDHPWLKEHHDWFAWRPDGSMKFAENPPKKYEDIVNVDFYAGASIPDLWVGLCEVVLFWAEQGVRIFRVDNPHTKPLPFWEWMMAEVRAKFPDALFLAEAFTRPKVMNRLGKIGFSQSYTYFTWRNTKAELIAYLTELSTPPVADFFRPNFFVNTPDINPVPLQTAGREGFLARATLAATLSGLWGVYCGFELCEATPLPGREEYLDSEKYQIRKWDWNRPGNIVAEITRLNHIRRFNPALQSQLGVSFLPADNDQIIFYEKATRDRSNVVLVAVNLMPSTTQSAAIELPLWKWALSDYAEIEIDDLVTDTSFTLAGKWQRVTLDAATPCAIWRVRPKG